MPGNIINITFNEDLAVNGYVYINATQVGFGGESINLDFEERWYVLRDAPKRVTTGTPTTTPGERSAINFQEAFGLDYNGTNLYTITRVANVVTITAINTSLTGISFQSGFALDQYGQPGYADVTFTFGTVSTATFKIDKVTYSPNPANVCDSVIVNVFTSTQASQILEPASLAGTVNTNPFSFVWPRGSSLTLKVKNGQNVEAKTSIVTARRLTADNYNAKIYNSPNGATVIIAVNRFVATYINQALLVLTYSLDGITYQDSNQFTGLAPGQYTVYLKDQYGCIKTLNFTIEEVSSGYKPYFHISKAMSLRFAYRVDFDANFRTDENTLSCESNVLLPYKEIQQFQSNDVITTQFKSNFSDNTATAIKQDGTLIDLPVIQKSNNIGVTDKRDATRVGLGNGKTGIYFTSGKTYDYTTNVENGTYALNGALPYWATENQYFSINNVWYQVDEVIFNEDLNADMIIIDIFSSFTPTTVIAASVFNLFNYEVYEFSIDFSLYNNQNLQIKIDCIDDNYGEVHLLSEKINVKDKQPGTVEIKYSNPTNTDVFYTTGIENLIRQGLAQYIPIADEDSETNRNDNNSYLLSSQVREAVQFVFKPVTLEIMRKMVQAFNHKILQIDGVYFVKNGNCEVSEPLGDTNTFVVKANLLKTAGPLNTNLSNSGNDIIDTSNTDVPGLIDIGDGNFIKY